MPKLTKLVSELAKKEGIQEITIASGEGLPITSNAKDVDRESAEGVDEVQQRLLKSGMKYLTFVDSKGMKVLYHDDKFYYIVRSTKIVGDGLIVKFRHLVDIEMEERENERQKREAEIHKIKEEREHREAEVKKIKEEREHREAEVKKIKAKHKKRETEAKEVKEKHEETHKEVEQVKAARGHKKKK